MSRIIAPRRSLILPRRVRQQQGGFIMNPFAHGSTPPPAAAAYWNPADKSVDVDLSESDHVATNPDVFGWACVRSVTSHGSGKWYAEIERISGVEPPICGLGTSAVGIEYNFVGSTAAGWSMQHYYPGYGSRAIYNNAIVGSPVSGVTDGSYQRLAYDADSGNLWTGDADEWVGGGDPAAGTSPTFTLASSTVLFVMASLFRAGSVSTSVRLRSAAGDMAGTIPSGFSAWG